MVDAEPVGRPGDLVPPHAGWRGGDELRSGTRGWDAGQGVDPMLEKVVPEPGGRVDPRLYGRGAFPRKEVARVGTCGQVRCEGVETVGGQDPEGPVGGVPTSPVGVRRDDDRASSCQGACLLLGQGGSERCDTHVPPETGERDGEPQNDLSVVQMSLRPAATPASSVQLRCHRIGPDTSVCPLNDYVLQNANAQPMRRADLEHPWGRHGTLT